MFKLRFSCLCVVCGTSYGKRLPMEAQLPLIDKYVQQDNFKLAYTEP